MQRDSSGRRGAWPAAAMCRTRAQRRSSTRGWRGRTGLWLGTMGSVCWTWRGQGSLWPRPRPHGVVHHAAEDGHTAQRSSRQIPGPWREGTALLCLPELAGTQGASCPAVEWGVCPHVSRVDADTVFPTQPRPSMARGLTQLAACFTGTFLLAHAQPHSPRCRLWLSSGCSGRAAWP